MIPRYRNASMLGVIFKQHNIPNETAPGNAAFEQIVTQNRFIGQSAVHRGMKRCYV